MPKKSKAWDAYKLILNSCLHDGKIIQITPAFYGKNRLFSYTILSKAIEKLKKDGYEIINPMQAGTFMDRTPLTKKQQDFINACKPLPNGVMMVPPDMRKRIKTNRNNVNAYVRALENKGYKFMDMNANVDRNGLYFKGKHYNLKNPVQRREYMHMKYKK